MAVLVAKIASGVLPLPKNMLMLDIVIISQRSPSMPPLPISINLTVEVLFNSKSEKCLAGISIHSCDHLTYIFLPGHYLS